jgi:cytochrome c-type biogenesis protein CcmH/NrfG
MTKDNLIFALGGTLVGVIIGVFITNSSAPKVVPQTQMVQESSSASSQQQPTDQGQLPEGHPPVNEAALQSKLAEQQEILKKDPENDEAIISIAGLNFDLKNYPEAIQWYEKAVKKHPEDANLITDLGSSYLWHGDYPKAIELFNKSLTIDPKHLQSLMNLGIAKMSMGDRAGAAASWEKVVQYYPDHPEVPMLKQAITKLRSDRQGS